MDKKYVFIESFDQVEVFDVLADTDKGVKMEPDEYCDMPDVSVSSVNGSFQVSVEAGASTHADLKAGNTYVAFVEGAEAWRKGQLPTDELMRRIVKTVELHGSLFAPQPDSWIESIAATLAYLLPRSAREEWVGDFRESVSELRRLGRSYLSVLLVAGGKFVLMFIALARVRLQDLISTRQKKTPE